MWKGKGKWGCQGQDKAGVKGKSKGKAKEKLGIAFAVGEVATPLPRDSSTLYDTHVHCDARHCFLLETDIWHANSGPRV